jgi:cytoskeletal protein RodZ
MKHFVIIIFLFILSLIVFFYSIKEGYAPGESTSPGSSSTSSGSSSTSPGSSSTGSNKVNTSQNSALEKFANALVTAFSPPPAETKKPLGKPAWTNVKELNDPTTLMARSPAGCKAEVQEAVTPLPIDDQAKTTISEHAKTVNSILDGYDLQLKKIEAILNKPTKIVALNKNVDSVVNLGVPSISVVYDEQSNTLLNLSVVKGIAGDKGDKPEPISGIGIEGDIGKAGVDGTNPIGNTFDSLPYWAK